MWHFQEIILALRLITASMIIDLKSASGDAGVTAVSDGANQFSSKLFSITTEQNQATDLIISPLSVDVVLAMAAAGAQGETEKQFKSVLSLPEQEAVAKTGYQSIIDMLNTVKNVELDIANKIFVGEKYPVKQTYKETTETYFRSASQSVDFAKSNEAANTINSWVEQQTNNRIKDIVKAGDLDASTALVLVNAVYFKGEWKKKFNPELTKNMPFHVNSKTVKDVPTMFMYDYFDCHKYPDFSLVELPYNGSEVSMYVIRPNEIDGLAKVERYLSNFNLNSILSDKHVCHVNLHLPKFKIESTLDLKDNLQSLGLTRMFTRSAEFTGISNIPLAISKVVQKAFIEVNEEGSEASAATEIEGETFSMPTEIEMNLDRPFLFIIQHKPSKSILFEGHVHFDGKDG